MPLICAVTSAGRLATVPSVHCVCATPRESLTDDEGVVVPDPALTSQSTRAPDTSRAMVIGSSAGAQPAINSAGRKM